MACRPPNRLRPAKALLTAAALALCAAPCAPALAQTAAPVSMAPLLTGDEPIVVTTHTIQTPDGPLTYEARAGRLPIRVDETGEIHGYVFFVAYVVKNRGANRPLTVAWNGGPTVPSIYLHTEFLGPRLVTPAGFVDNPQTLLRQTDLVFYDPVETGFSRVAKPEFAPEFFNMMGDIAVAGEFVRAYRARFDAQSQPLFLLGESYGVFRVAGVSDYLTARGMPIAGLVILSGGFPGVKMSLPMFQAMNIPNRTATAVYYKRLAPDRMRDRDVAIKQATDWARSTYLHALESIDSLSDGQRDQVARQLAAYTGWPADKIDRKTLTVSTQDFLSGFLGQPTKVLSEVDTRVIGDEAQPPSRHLAISRYLRQELGYATDLGYAGELGYGTDMGYRALEAGYVPIPGPKRRSSGAQWVYNQSPGAAEALAKGIKDGEVIWLTNENPPWMEGAMGRQPALRVFVALGRYDPTNQCEGLAWMTHTLPDDLQARIESHCYEGGHMMYRDAAERMKVSADLGRFIVQSSSVR